ncbi:MAG: hypothetical protein A3J97_09975 [Spirochaetes bacterium RIFOXYC1_FULL_54_7]|nr:MAG: hypothetical protein A3J97_09975 [Spirochaetes bacterium RIFOXYC1_FULL_54_7]
MDRSFFSTLAIEDNVNFTTLKLTRQYPGKSRTRSHKLFNVGRTPDQQVNVTAPEIIANS